MRKPLKNEFVRVPVHVANSCVDFRKSGEVGDCSGNKFRFLTYEEIMTELDELFTDLLQSSSSFPIHFYYADTDNHKRLIAELRKINIPVIVITNQPIPDEVLDNMKNFWCTVQYVLDSCEIDPGINKSIKNTQQRGLHVLVQIKVVPGETKLKDVSALIDYLGYACQRFTVKFANMLDVQLPHTNHNGEYYYCSRDFKTRFISKLNTIFSCKPFISIAVCGNCDNCKGVEYLRYKNYDGLFLEDRSYDKDENN